MQSLPRYIFLLYFNFLCVKFLQHFFAKNQKTTLNSKFWETSWEFWEFEAPQSPLKWTLRIFLDSWSKALSQLQVGQNCDFCHRFSSFSYLRPFKVSLLSPWPSGLEINCHYRLDFSLTTINIINSMRGCVTIHLHPGDRSGAKRSVGHQDSNLHMIAYGQISLQPCLISNNHKYYKQYERLRDYTFASW